MPDDPSTPISQRPDRAAGEDHDEIAPSIPRISGRQMIKDAAEDVKTHISRQPHVQRLFSFMPTLMTRVSPFHFKSRFSSKQWPMVRLDSGEGIHWGRMLVVGELLIIYDETILLSLLALLRKNRCDAFETSRNEICRIIDDKPGPASGNAIWRSILRLSGTRIDLQLCTGRGKRRKVVKEMTGSILSYADRDPETGAIHVAVNPYFLEMYGESFVTNIDLRFRAGLKRDVSKAFYRFYQGMIAAEHEIEIRRLAHAVNLSVDGKMWRLREKIRTGLRELKDAGYLDGFEITKDGVVAVAKSAEMMLRNTGLSLENEIP
ncbi:MAG: hypothetical protein GY859_03310 [Desulfobacterales bacterium]|nr:hypothetical protein [Desulfobacterales bacterium]